MRARVLQFSSIQGTTTFLEPKRRQSVAVVMFLLLLNRDFDHEGLLDLILMKWSLETKIFTQSVLKKPRQQVVDHNKRGDDEQATYNPESTLNWTCL